MSRVGGENKYFSFTGYSFLFLLGGKAIVFGRIGLWDPMVRHATA